MLRKMTVRGSGREFARVAALASRRGGSASRLCRLALRLGVGELERWERRSLGPPGTKGGESTAKE